MLSCRLTISYNVMKNIPQIIDNERKIVVSKQTLIAALKSEIEMTVGEIAYFRSVSPDPEALAKAYARADRLRAMLNDAEDSLASEERELISMQTDAGACGHTSYKALMLV